MITNELIFVVMILAELTFLSLLMRFGKEGLFAFISTNIILVSTFGTQLIDLFGNTTNAGNVFYAAIFLAANILTEHYGRKTGLRSVWIGFSTLVLFVMMSQFVIRHVSAPDSIASTQAIQTLFRGVPRLAFASMCAYLIAQCLNVWLFDKLHKSSGGARLWLRNIVSSTLGQLVDSLVFFSIAFIGIVPTGVLAQTILVGFILKAFIAVVGTPVLYLSYWLLEPKRGPAA